MSYRRYGAAGRAQPRKEWDDLLAWVRHLLGCDGRAIRGNFRVQRRYLAHSARMTIYCGRTPGGRKTFKLGYVEVHEEPLVSYEYSDWLKEAAGVPGEVFLDTGEPQWRQRLEDFVTALGAAAEQFWERQGRQQLEREAAERERLERERSEREAAEREAAERQRLERQRSEREAAERRRVRRVKERQRRERQRELAAERERQLAGRRAREQAELELRRRREAAERERRERLERLRLERGRQWRAGARRRREEFAEVGVVIPPDGELLHWFDRPVAGRWRPHPVDLGLVAAAIGGLLYWLVWM